MIYEVGDCVVPCDLPRSVRCRVEAVERQALLGGEVIQILTLAPLEGPWRPGTLLIRLDGAVAPAAATGNPAAIASATRAARDALDGRRRPRKRAKVIRLPVESRRLSVDPEP